MTTLNDIYGPVKDDLKLVEASLEQIARANLPLLSEMLEFSLLNVGKRLRPVLTLLSGKFYDYNLKLLVPMAAAVEVLHIGTLVHDDIIDSAAMRHGKEAVHCKYGTNSAILLGDYLFSRAGSLAAMTNNLRVIKRFSETLMTISGGELKEARLNFIPASARDNYFLWIRDKTACLFVLAAECGGVLSTCPEDQITALKEYALNFGLAFQIIDDTLDFVGDQNMLGKPVGSDLMEGAITLPFIIYAEQHPTDGVIAKIVMQGRKELVPQAVEKVCSSGAIDVCRKIAGQFCAKACDSLKNLPDCEARKSLIALAKFVVDREH